jgi:hypothetical protein
LKTKIVVFRNRGVLKENGKWYLDGKMIELCNQFVYLGLLFNYNGIFTVTQKTLSEQGKKWHITFGRNRIRNHVYIWAKKKVTLGRKQLLLPVLHLPVNPGKYR